MVLLVVDTQKEITTPDLFQFEQFRSNVMRLIAAARRNGVAVIFVRHDDGVGSTMTKGTEGFEIYEDFLPGAGELILDKNVNSAFRDTGLAAYLKQKQEQEIMISGLQTDYCIDATVKAGFEHGFTMIVPAYCNTTFDNPYMSAAQTYHYYNEFIWNKRYAQCISFEDALDRIRS